MRSAGRGRGRAAGQRALTLIAAAALVAGCARLPTQSDGLGFGERETRLDAIDRWEMRGRLAIDTGERSFQARFFWRQDETALTLTVRGLLGAGSFEISGTPETLTVRARGETRVLTEPEIELSEMFGWWLPVTSLRDWLVGLPDEAYPATPTIARGTLVALDQRLWRLDYEEYQLSTAGLLVPRRIALRHAPLELILTVDDWEPLPADEALN